MTGVEVGQGHSGLLPLEVPCVSGSQSIPRAFRHMPKAVRSQTTVTVDTEPFLSAGPHISEPCLRDGISPVCISGNNILSDISEFTLYCQTHSIELLSALPVSLDNEGTRAHTAEPNRNQRQRWNSTHSKHLSSTYYVCVEHRGE